MRIEGRFVKVVWERIVWIFQSAPFYLVTFRFAKLLPRQIQKRLKVGRTNLPSSGEIKICISTSFLSYLICLYAVEWTRLYLLAIFSFLVTEESISLISFQFMMKDVYCWRLDALLLNVKCTLPERSSFVKIIAIQVWLFFFIICSIKWKCKCLEMGFTRGFGVARPLVFRKLSGFVF